MNKKTIIILILFIIFLAVVFLLDWPIYQKYLSLKNEVDTQKNLLASKEELLTKVQQLENVYEEQQDKIEKTEYVLPTSKKIPELIVQFEALASESGLILEELYFKEQKATGPISQRGVEEGQKEIRPYKVLNIFLSVTGSYESFRAFVKALEYNIRLLDIQKIKFSAEESQEVNGFIFDLELTAYYQE